jgi:transmembrane sensor
MTDDVPLDPQQLDGYLAGDLSVAERERVTAWLLAHPVTAAIASELPRAALGEAADADTERSWRVLSARLTAAGDVDDLSRQRAIVDARRATRRPWWQRTPARIAAALMLVVGSLATWRATISARGGSLTAPIGRDVTATLPDGTRLTLAAGSRARWTASYGTTSREIALDGEAFFDVVHDGTMPFRVRSRDAVVEDIGTRFVVRAWPELSAVEVAVEEGLVALTDSLHARADRGTVLHAGERGRLASGGQVRISPDAEAAIAWTRGQLAFDNEPLRTVLPAISRRFNVDVRADSALATRLLSARFAAQSLPEVLDAIAVSLDVRVVTNGRTITLIPQAP